VDDDGLSLGIGLLHLQEITRYETIIALHTIARLCNRRNRPLHIYMRNIQLVGSHLTEDNDINDRLLCYQNSNILLLISWTYPVVILLEDQLRLEESKIHSIKIIKDLEPLAAPATRSITRKIKAFLIREHTQDVFSCVNSSNEKEIELCWEVLARY